MKRIPNKRKSLHSLALIAASALAGLAVPAFPETAGSIYLGASHIGNSDVRITQPDTGSDATFHDVSWNSESFNNPVYYGIRLNHFFEKHPDWGFGLDFTHDKVFARVDQAVQVDGTWNGAPVNEAARMDQRVQSFSISHGVNTLALNGYRRWSLGADSFLPCPRCRPYVGAGPTWYVLHAENTVNGQHNDEGYKSGGFGYQLLLGLHFRITPLLGIFIETKHNRGKVEVDIAGGHAETTLKSTQLLAGLSIGL